MFGNQITYLREINQAYKDSATNKKNKEALLHNIKNIITHLNGPLQQTTNHMNRTRDEYR